MSDDGEAGNHTEPLDWLRRVEELAGHLEFEALCNEDDQSDVALVRDLGVLLGGFAAAVRDQDSEARERIVASARAHLKSKLEALVPPPGTYLVVERSDAMRELQRTFAKAAATLRGKEGDGGGADLEGRRELATAIVDALLDLPEVVRSLRMQSGIVGRGRAPSRLPTATPGIDERAEAVDVVRERLKRVLHGAMNDAEVAKSLIKAAVTKLGMNGKDLFAFEQKAKERAIK